MRSYRYIKTAVLAVLLFITIESTGQSSDTWDGYEITVDVGGSKLKSDYKNYDSKWKPPDWWATLWAWSKAIANFLYGGGGGNTGGSGGTRQNAALMSTEGNASGLSDDGYVPAAGRSSNFSYGIGLGIGTKGGKFQFGANTFRHNIYYLQIPILARYDHPLENGDRLFAALGPYYAVALAGRAKSDNAKESLQFGNDGDADYKRGDFGLKLRLGYKPQSLPISVGLTGDLGFRNLVPESNVLKIRTRLFAVQVGYGF